MGWPNTEIGNAREYASKSLEIISKMSAVD